MSINKSEFMSQQESIELKRNRWPYEKEINFNMKMGEITPLTCIRVYPGMTLNLDVASILKVAPLKTPPMQNAVFKLFAFYAPDRISWDNYKYWFGEAKNPENPDEENTYLVPKVTLPKGGFAYNSFYDNIGCPPNVGNYKINAYLPRADRQIYNNYFRNQALENPLEVNRTDADDDPNQNMALRKLCKYRDIFTACLPTQSGAESVEIPLGTEAPVTVSVYGNGNVIGLMDAAKRDFIIGGNNSQSMVYTNSGLPQGISENGITPSPISGTLGLHTDPTKSGIIGKGIADLTKTIGAPIEGLYQAIAYNTYQYMLSRGGSRYFEHISNVYGIANPEGVIQIPEFLGSASQFIEFDTVTQLSEGTNAGLGHRAANGYCEIYNNLINKSFGEFGYILIYGAVTYKPKYQMGVSKQLQEDDLLEMFNPIFNLMGDEAIFNSEIYVQDDDVVNEQGEPVNNDVFGYNRRNSRIIYQVDEIHGEQRSQYKLSLDTNHFSEDFDKLPVLNKDFDKVTDEGFKRALAVTDETQFIGIASITGTQDIQIPFNAIPSPLPDIIKS